MDVNIMKTKKLNLVNAQQMALDHPDTFEAPTNEELALLKAGSLIKVCNEGERFWCKVLKVELDYMLCSVNNELMQKGLRFEDEIEVGFENVYTIWGE